MLQDENTLPAINCANGKCKKRIIPTSEKQKYCLPCGIEIEKEKQRKYNKIYQEKKKAKDGTPARTENTKRETGNKEKSKWTDPLLQSLILIDLQSAIEIKVIFENSTINITRESK